MLQRHFVNTGSSGLSSWRIKQEERDTICHVSDNRPDLARAGAA